MSGIRAKLYRGKWCAVWTDEKGRTKRVSLRCGGKETPRIVAEQCLVDARKAAPVGDTAGEIFSAYSTDLKERKGSNARAEDAWKALKPRFAHLRPDQIDRPLCRAYAAERRRRGRKNGTIRKELETLRTALRWHDKHNRAQFEIPPSAQPRERHLTRAEYGRLRRAAFRTPHVWLFVILALATGARKEALLELTWSRIDEQRGLIRLATDTEGRRKGRATVPMNRHARRALAVMRERAVTPYVIEYAGQKVGDVKKAFARVVDRAKLDDVTPHVLRHTAAVWMAEAGVPMAEIAQFLGHSDSRITERVYARFSPAYLRHAARVLE